MIGIVLTQVQDLAFALVELHEIHRGPLKPVKVPLDGIPSLQQANCTTQLGVVSKFAVGALNSSVYANSKDVLCKGFLTPETKVTQANYSKPLNKEAHGLVEPIK